MTLDSLDYASDSTFAGTHFSAPTVAYSLVRSNAVLVVERYRENVPGCGMRHYTSSSGARSSCTVTPRNSSCLVIRRTRSDLGPHVAAPLQGRRLPPRSAVPPPVIPSRSLRPLLQWVQYRGGGSVSAGCHGSSLSGLRKPADGPRQTTGRPRIVSSIRSATLSAIGRSAAAPNRSSADRSADRFPCPTLRATHPAPRRSPRPSRTSAASRIARSSARRSRTLTPVSPATHSSGGCAR